MESLKNIAVSAKQNYKQLATTLAICLLGLGAKGQTSFDIKAQPVPAALYNIDKNKFCAAVDLSLLRLSQKTKYGVFSVGGGLVPSVLQDGSPVLGAGISPGRKKNNTEVRVIGSANKAGNRSIGIGGRVNLGGKGKKRS